MTPEELDAWVQEDVRKQLKPKKPPPKEPVDPAGKKFYLSMMCQPKPPLSVPPLVVLSKEDEATAEFVKETNLTKAQLLGQEKIPVTKGQEESHLYWGNFLCGQS